MLELKVNTRYIPVLRSYGILNHLNSGDEKCSDEAQNRPLTALLHFKISIQAQQHFAKYSRVYI